MMNASSLRSLRLALSTCSVVGVPRSAATLLAAGNPRAAASTAAAAAAANFSSSTLSSSSSLLLDGAGRPTTFGGDIESPLCHHGNIVQFQSHRSVHSMRQKKRMANHPARLRVMRKIREAQEDGSTRGGAEGTVVFSNETNDATSWEPQFPPVVSPELLPNGWSAPPPNQADLLSQYPFQIGRTLNKPMDAAGFLPVYTRMRKDGTKVTTRIKGVTGDMDAFVREMRASIPPLRDAAITFRATGATLEVKGNHVRPIKAWLAGLGF